MFNQFFFKLTNKLIIFLIIVEIPLFTSFTSFKQAVGNKTDRSDSIDDDLSSDYFSEDLSYSSSDSGELDNSIDLVQELRQESYIWTAVKEFPLR